MDSGLLALTVAFIIAILFVLLAFYLLRNTVNIVQQGFVGVVKRLGEFRAVHEPGLVIIAPFIDSLVTVDMREFPRPGDRQEVITKDNVVVAVNATIFTQVVDAKQALFSIANFDVAIDALARTALRSVIGTLTLDEALSERERINIDVQQQMEVVTDKWGIRINRIEIVEITPPQQILQALALQKQADQEKRAKILQSEGIQQSAVNVADGEKQAAIKQAEGDRQAAILRAEGEKQATIIKAEATQKELEFEGAGEAAKIERVGRAEAAKVLAVGEAEAEVIKKKLLAEAEGLQKKSEAWRNFNEAAVLNMIVEKMPELAQAFATQLAGIDKINIIDMGNGAQAGGVGKVMGTVGGGMSAMLAMLKDQFGIDIARLVQAKTDAAAADAEARANPGATGKPKA